MGRSATEGLAARRDQLVSERERLVTNLADLDRSARVDDWHGDSNLDLADQALSSWERDHAQVMATEVRERIRALDRALLRLDDGSYGRCERCDRAIEPARLDLLPHTTTCALHSGGGRHRRERNPAA